MRLISSAFGNYDQIPVKYTGEGDDVSPPLRWQDVPTGVRSFALICEDPDAPHATWDHWIIYNIPSSMSVLAEGLREELPQGAQSCLNSWGKPGYGGPNPPSGNHRYFFTLYALDTVLLLPEGATKANLLNIMRGHTLAEATLVGCYERQHKVEK